MSLESLLAYLWNPKISLRKQAKKPWKQLDIYKIEKKNEDIESYLDSTFLCNALGKMEKQTTFNKLGETIETNDFQYPDEFTETSSLISRMGESKDIMKFNKAGFLIEDISLDPWGDTEVTKYFYGENHRLEKVIQKNEDGQTVEDLIYKDGKLHKIETSNDNGVSLFRGFIYDAKGLLEKVIRMQNEFVNMEEKYFYNEKNELIREIHESVNRLKDGKTPLMITEYSYYSNGVKKLETFKIIDSYQGKTKSESKDYYDESGLLVKEESHDYIEETETIYEYRYS